MKEIAVSVVCEECNWSAETNVPDSSNDPAKWRRLISQGSLKNLIIQHHVQSGAQPFTSGHPLFRVSGESINWQISYQYWSFNFITGP